MKKLAAAALVAFSLVGFQANAGIMFEPFFNMKLAKTVITTMPQGNVFGATISLHNARLSSLEPTIEQEQSLLKLLVVMLMRTPLI